MRVLTILEEKLCGGGKSDCTLVARTVMMGNNATISIPAYSNHVLSFHSNCYPGLGRLHCFDGSWHDVQSGQTINCLPGSNDMIFEFGSCKGYSKIYKCLCD